ncbi:hypothetical protein C8F04DRAFT_1254490 [Mycena alexandri]|uniref:Uncharacterized protein n=1 Tax=Mycena alexandri TaxID=1745969 RepID=A0AAD6T608_9AGAR|nr:hypothetical protein C8F04DRAFT_1254490 [Mycena alexandri]
MRISRLLPPLGRPSFNHPISRVRPGLRLLCTPPTKVNAATDPIDPYRPDPSQPWPDPDYMRPVWNHWHQTTVPLPPYSGWSCQWGLWTHTSLLFDPKNPGFLELLLRGSGIPAREIEPLLYLDQWATEPLFIFAFRGRYFFFDGGRDRIWRIKGEFEGHNDFLRKRVNHPNFPVC